MRAVSLSNPSIIAQLNSSYVPVFVSNEDFTDKGAAPAEEKAELRRIFQEGYAKKLSVGSVHVYILAPDGHLIDSLHTAEAAKPEVLLPLLQRNAKNLRVTPGNPILPPAPAAPPVCEPGSVLLRLVSRYIERKNGEEEPVETTSGDWTALPSEDWIMLSQSEAASLLPSGKPVVGQNGRPDAKTVASLLLHFYPPTENWELSNNTIDQQTLNATVVSLERGIAHVRLQGHLRMKHWFYHKPDDRYVDTAIEGYMEYDIATRRLRSLRLVTTGGEYRGSGAMLPYGVAVRER